MTGYRISDIPVHDSTPPMSAKMELENPTGPTSEYSLLWEVFGTILFNYKEGLTLSNNVSTPNTVLDIASGMAQSDDYTTLMSLASALTKSISSTWAVGTGNGGLDIGAVLASTTYHAYEIMRTDTGVVDVLLSQAPPPTSATLTATSASPCVFTWNGGTPLPFQNGCPFVLSGTTAPTGFTLGTLYYIVASNVTAGTFELSATQGGSAINSSSTGSALIGTPTVRMPTNYTKKRRIGSVITDASSHILSFTQTNNRITYTNIQVDAGGVTVPTTATLKSLTIPVGIKVVATFRGVMASAGGSAGIIFQSPDEASVLANASPGNDSLLQGIANVDPGGHFGILTNVAGQLRWSAFGASATGFIMTFGYIDFFGK